MSQVTDIPRWKMLSDPVDEPVAVPRWKQLSDPVDTAPPQTDFGPDQVTIDSPGWQDSPPVSDSPLTPDMQARAEADPVYQELQRRKAGQPPVIDPYSSQGRINTLASAEPLISAEWQQDGPATPAGAYTPLSPDIQPRGLLGNIGASAGQTAIHAIPRVIRDELPMSLQHPRPVEEGTGKVIGEAIGGLIPSTERPGDLLAMTKLFGAAEKAAAPLVKRIEAAAGPRVAAIAEKSLAGAGSAAPFGAMHEAGSNFEEWQTDPARKLGKVMLAGGGAFAAGGLGGAGMGAIGGRSTHTDAMTEARTAAEGRQWAEDTGRAFDPSTGTPEPTPEPATNANRPAPIGDRVAQESVPVTVPDNRLADAPEAGPRVAEAGLVKDGNPAESQIVTQPTPPIGESVAPVPESPATLDAQMQAMRDGKRPAVLVTEGAAMPDKGEFAKLKTDAGVFIYDPKQVKPTEIKAAVAEDRVGDILGMGIPRKPEPGTEAGVVVVRTPEGVEKQAVVTDEASMPAVTEAARKMAGPGETVGLETAEGVVRGRVEPTVSHDPQGTGGRLGAGDIERGSGLQADAQGPSPEAARSVPAPVGQSALSRDMDGVINADADVAYQRNEASEISMFGEPEVRRARTDEPPGEEGGPETTGIAHRVSEAQGMEVERGVGIGPLASVERGRQLLKAGADPAKIVARFKSDPDKRVGHDDMAVMRAWEANRAKNSAAADEKYGHGSKQSDAAFQEWTQAKADTKLMQTEWAKTGVAQQGETEIDTGTFHGMRAAHHEAGGKDFTPKQAESAKKLSSEVKAKTEAVEAAKEVVRDVTPEVELEPSAKSLADRIVAKLDKASTESLDWLKKNYLAGTTLRSGIDPTALYHLSRYGAAKIAKGVVKFSAWSAEMVKDLGESIQPHLKAVWEAADKELDRLVMADQSHAAAVKQAKVKPPKVATPETIAARANSKSSATAISNVAKDLSRAFIRKGIKDREANVDAVHDALSKVLPTLTREQTSDAMSGYGDYRPLNKDPVEVRRREIAGEVQQVRKLQDMASGKAPKRSGVERQAPTDEARDLTRRVNDAKKAGGYVTTDPATQLRTALDARKTYVRNRITDLQKQIDDGVKAKKSNKPAPTDAALDALRARLKKVQEHYDKKFPEDKTPQQIQAIKDQIAELDKHLKAGTVPGKKGQTAPSKDVADLRAQRDALRARVMHADPARRDAIRKQISELEGHLRAGTKPAPRPATPAPADIQKLRDKREALAKQLRKPPPVDVSAHPPGTVMTPERVKALWKLAIPHVESGVTNFGTLADILAKQTKLPTSDIRSGLSAKGAAKKKLAELDDAAWALYKAKKNARDWLRAQAPKTPLQKVLHYSGALRALETTGEFSVLGIQAASRLPISIGHAITHPFNPKMLRQDVRTFYRGLQAFSPRKAHEIDLEMQRSPRYQEAQRAGVRLYDEEHTPTGLEEIKTRSFLDRVWGVKHSLRGFDRFSRIVLNDIKLNHYQMLAETMPGGKPTKQQAKVIADIANLIGGTTNLGKAEAIAGSANALLFSARLAAARARFLASPVEFSIRGTNETRLAYAKTMAQWMIGNTAIYGAFALAGYEIGDDPRSNKFGKVKIGETWVDMTGGLSSYVTLGARQATGQTITDKGNLKDLGGPGPYDQSRLSIAATFARGKLSPWASLFVDYMDNQHNVIGQPMDAEYFARKITPLTWWDVAQAVREESPNDAAAISVLALFGKGVRNRPDDKKDK